MKKAFYLVAALSAALFCISAFNLNRHHYPSGFDFSLHGNGFNAAKADSKHDEVRDKLLSCIRIHKDEADRNQVWYFWLNFLVTTLTAASTLVSSIQAAKKTPAEPPAPNAANRFAIVVAILTFLSTLANFGATQFNERKNNAAKSLATATQNLNDFYRKYDTAKSDDERNQANKEYDEKICDQ